MSCRLASARLVDPTSPLNGQEVDIVVDGPRIASVTPVDGAVSVRSQDRTIDMRDTLVMAGGIDLHTHIGGGKLNLARILMAERLAHRRLRQRGPIWSSIETGRKYIEMGYTACFEPAMLLSQARAAHLQLSDTPMIDSGAYVVMGNEDWLLRALGRGLEPPRMQELVAWTVQASRAMAVKVVNAGGINAFKFNQRLLDVDQPHPQYGCTPRSVIKALASAIDALGLPHPLHVHASNLGVPGNIRSTLATLDAADGHRLHLTHAQFNAYSDDGPFGMGSGAMQLAERINRSPELSIDVGQIVFGQTVTISADAQAQFRNSRHVWPRKAIVSDVECMGGCGVVPMRYQDSHYVNSLQWTIGLELLLLIDNPHQVLLTTDHPNGGPFTSYPHLIRLLMDRSFRDAALAAVHPRAAEQSLLKSLDREYTLDEVAMLTRAAPARLLGLRDRGRIFEGALADLAFYCPRSDWESTFSQARSVWKSGTEVLRDGRMLDGVATQCMLVEPLPNLGPPDFWRGAIEESLRIPMGMLEISADEFSDQCSRGRRNLEWIRLGDQP